MWVKLSDNEVLKKRTAKSRTTAKYAAILAPLVFAVTQKVGYDKRKSISTWEPLTWHELFSSAHLYLLAGILIYAIIIYAKKNYKPVGGIRFCIICEKHYDSLTQQKCTCGGDIDYLELYKYVHNKDNS